MDLTSRRRPRATLAAVLAALLLALLSTLTNGAGLSPTPVLAHGPTSGVAYDPTPGPATRPAYGQAAAAVEDAAAGAGHRDTGTRVDGGCDTDCAVRAAVRQESPGEHPAPRSHPVAGAQRTTAPPPGAGARLRAPAPPLAVAPPPLSPGLERAPPRRPAPDAPFPSP
ncbi:hypothetical protein ACFW2V_40695 [Streptomyces sp. NPDC058947]|uniref:hypothetical protein n=1 Tax=Streptomyces sp. NPDC058947 TaxID=3346675 RepID=UPI00369DB52A